MKIAVRVLIVMAALCVAVVVAVRLFFPEEKIKGILTKEMSERLGHDVSIESVSLGLYPDLELVAREIQVIDRSTSQLLLSTGRIRIDMSLSELLRRRYVVETVNIGAPTLNLIRGADGMWNIEKLFPAKKGDGDTVAGEAGGAAPGAFDIGVVRVRNGAMGIRDEASGFGMSVTKIKADVDLKKDTISLSSAFVSLPATDAKLSGTIVRFSKPGRVFRIKADAQVRKSGPLAGFGPEGLKSGSKIADISFMLSGPMTEIAIEGDASMEQRATWGIDTTASLSGTLLTNEGVFEVAALDVSYGQCGLSFSGVCADLWSDNRSIRLEGTGGIVLAEAVKPAGAEMVATIEPEGKASVVVELTGSMKQVELKTSIDITGAGFTMPQLMRKQAGAPGSLAIDAYYALPGEFIVDGFKLALGDEKLTGKAQIKPGSEPWAQASIRAVDFPLDALDRLPSVGFEREGRASFAARAWQSTRGQNRMSYRGKGKIEHALLAAAALNYSISIESAMIEFENDRVSMRSASVSFAGSSCTVAAEMTDFDNPRITGMIRADTIDLDKIARAFAKDETGAEILQPASDEAKTGSNISAEIEIEANSLKAGDLRTGPVSTTLKASGKTYAFAPFDMEIFGGRLGGSIVLDSSGRYLQWATDFEGRDMRLEELAGQFQKGEMKFKGLLYGKGSLRGIAAPKTEQVLGSMEGDLSLRITEGEIREYLLFKNIFILMQVSPATLLVPGLREITALNTIIDAAKTSGRSLNPMCVVFNKIDGTFNIEDGVAHTEDLRLESGIADLLFKGDIDLGEGSLDMRISATPLGSVGSAIGKVPIAGKQLKRAKESVLSTDFIARGPISDPEVKLAVMENLRPRSEEEQE